MLLLLMTILSSAACASLTAEVEIRRSYIDWSTREGAIKQDVPCRATMELAVVDRRLSPTPEKEEAEFICESAYRDTPVKVSLRGLVEITSEPGRQNGPPVLRTLFLLAIDEGEDFPYLQESQRVTGWQVYQEQLTPQNQSFLLSPEAFLSINCGALGCTSSGAQTIFRAYVRLRAH